jgi:uncharacterized protein YdhG (YjbR/CyaY superfamily)
MRPTPPATIDDYIASQTPEVAAILEKIRVTVREAAPQAKEKISYGMPTFALEGDLVTFGAFKKHIGLFPPVRDETLKAETAIYAGEKGNLRFPLSAPIPHELIGRIVRARVAESGKAGRRKPRE